MVRGVNKQGATVTREISAESIGEAEVLAMELGIDVRAVARAGEGTPRATRSGGLEDADSALTGSEEVLWEGKPSHWPNAWRWALVLTIPWAIWEAVQLATTRMTLTTQRLKVKSGVFTTRIEEVELYRVRDSTLTQGLLQRLVGLGTVVLQTTDATTPTVLFANVTKAHELREIARKAVERVRRVQRVREIEMT
jgi:membrane protein YdbS with pleckstrin-like domain